LSSPRISSGGFSLSKILIAPYPAIALLGGWIPNLIHLTSGVSGKWLGIFIRPLDIKEFFIYNNFVGDYFFSIKLYISVDHALA
jgi:hypothetical protein